VGGGRTETHLSTAGAWDLRNLRLSVQSRNCGACLLLCLSDSWTLLFFFSFDWGSHLELIIAVSLFSLLVPVRSNIEFLDGVEVELDRLSATDGDVNIAVGALVDGGLAGIAAEVRHPRVLQPRLPDAGGDVRLLLGVVALLGQPCGIALLEATAAPLGPDDAVRLRRSAAAGCPRR